MPSGTAIQRVYTLDDVVKRVVARLDIIDPEENIKPKIVKEANVQQKNIYKKLIAEDDKVKAMYMQGATFTFTTGEQTFDVIEVSNPLIYEIQRLDATESNGRVYGSVPFIDSIAFRNIGSVVYFDNSILYSVEGRRIKLFTGQNFNATGFVYKIWYIREVNVLTIPADYLDIPSTSFDELLNNVMNVFAPQQTEAKVETK